MKQQLVTFISSIMLLSACTEEQKDACVYFTRDSFPEQVELEKPDPVRLEDTYNDPTAFYLIRDSFVLVNNQPHSDHLVEIFSLPTGKCVASLAPKGQGPDDFASGYCYTVSSLFPYCYIQDTGTLQFYCIDIGRTLQEHRLSVVNKFSYDAEIHPYSMIVPVDDEHYIGYQMWHLDDSTYNNNVPPFRLYPVRNAGTTEPKPAPDPMQYNYFVADVNGGLLLKIPGRTLWLADMHKDKITIYDDSLHLVKTLVGPDRCKPEYEERKSNIPIPFIVFKNDKRYAGYRAWTQTDKHVYLIYEGLDGKAYDPENLPPVEVFKFDLDGNPVCCYHLDRFAYHISVDSREKFLYATTRQSYKEPAEFVRYRL